MAKSLSGQDVASKIGEHFPDAVSEFDDTAVIVKGESLLEVARFLKENPAFKMDYLSFVTAVDSIDYFEVVYRLDSIELNHGIVLKARCHERDNPTLPSVYELWQGADFQEREVYDLMGVSFTGHPNLKRLFLWHGFEGHPLRKDFGKAAEAAPPAEGEGAKSDDG